MNRRTFLKHGSGCLAAAAVIPYLTSSGSGDMQTMTNYQNSDLNQYYNRFGVDETIIHEVISEALSKGGDYCDVYFQHSISNRISLEDTIVNQAGNTIDFGVGIRVLKGDQTGYSFTEEITPEAMKQAARTAAAIAESGRTAEPVELKLHKGGNYYPIETPWETVSIDSKVPPIQKINDVVFALDKRIIKTNMSFYNQTSYILIATSEGRIVYDYQPMVIMNVNCTAQQNDRREQNFYGMASRYGMEFVNDDNIQLIARETVRRTVELFDAVKPAGGEMPVVLAPGSSGILLHEAIGHGMEADFNR
ncbi:MAG: TldD/PmbA family protein, partial [Sedimentisphaerales bacterium]|nr:TldD/PmbA family protein [Sedimentisphaerales bacterium]